MDICNLVIVAVCLRFHRVIPPRRCYADMHDKIGSPSIVFLRKVLEDRGQFGPHACICHRDGGRVRMDEDLSGRSRRSLRGESDGRGKRCCNQVRCVDGIAFEGLE